MTHILGEDIIDIGVIFFSTDRFEVIIGKAVAGVSLNAKLTGGRIDYFITDLKNSSVKLFDAGVDLELIAEAEWEFVGAIHRKNGHHQTHILDKLKGHTDLFEEIDTGLFEYPDIIGMVNDIHFIGFVVKNFSFIGNDIFQKKDFLSIEICDIII